MRKELERIIEEENLKEFENNIALNYTYIKSLSDNSFYKNNMFKNRSDLMRQLTTSLENKFLDKIFFRLRYQNMYIIYNIYSDEDLPACFKELSIDDFVNFSYILGEIMDTGLYDKNDVYKAFEVLYKNNKNKFKKRMNKYNVLLKKDGHHINRVFDKFMEEIEDIIKNK